MHPFVLLSILITAVSAQSEWSWDYEYDTNDTELVVEDPFDRWAQYVTTASSTVSVTTTTTTTTTTTPTATTTTTSTTTTPMTTTSTTATTTLPTSTTTTTTKAPSTTTFNVMEVQEEIPDLPLENPDRIFVTGKTKDLASFFQSNTSSTSISTHYNSCKNDRLMLRQEVRAGKIRLQRKINQLSSCLQKQTEMRRVFEEKLQEVIESNKKKTTTTRTIVLQTGDQQQIEDGGDQKLKVEGREKAATSMRANNPCNICTRCSHACARCAAYIRGVLTEEDGLRRCIATDAEAAVRFSTLKAEEEERDRIDACLRSSSTAASQISTTTTTTTAPTAPPTTAAPTAIYADGSPSPPIPTVAPPTDFPTTPPSTTPLSLQAADLLSSNENLRTKRSTTVDVHEMEELSLLDNDNDV